MPSGTKKEDRLCNQTEAMKNIIIAIRQAKSVEHQKLYKETRDKFIFNMF